MKKYKVYAVVDPFRPSEFIFIAEFSSYKTAKEMAEKYSVGFKVRLVEEITVVYDF